jgi:hypothetical protein
LAIRVIENVAAASVPTNALGLRLLEREDEGAHSIGVEAVILHEIHDVQTDALVFLDVSDREIEPLGQRVVRVAVVLQVEVVLRTLVWGGRDLEGLSEVATLDLGVEEDCVCCNVVEHYLSVDLEGAHRGGPHHCAVNRLLWKVKWIRSTLLRDEFLSQGVCEELFFGDQRLRLAWLTNNCLVLSLLWVEGDACVVEDTELLVGDDGAGLLDHRVAADPVDEARGELLREGALLVEDNQLVFSHYINYN